MCVYHTCVYVSYMLVYMCICISLVHVLSLWTHQHFHGTVQWLRNALVLTSFWCSKSTTIPACLICLFLSHSASKLREEWLERKTEWALLLKGQESLNREVSTQKVMRFFTNFFRNILTGQLISVPSSNRVVLLSLFSSAVTFGSPWGLPFPSPVGFTGVHLLNTKTSRAEVGVGWGGVG